MPRRPGDLGHAASRTPPMQPGSCCAALRVRRSEAWPPRASGGAGARSRCLPASAPPDSDSQPASTMAASTASGAKPAAVCSTIQSRRAGVTVWAMVSAGCPGETPADRVRTRLGANSIALGRKIFQLLDAAHPVLHRVAHHQTPRTLGEEAHDLVAIGLALFKHAVHHPRLERAAVHRLEILFARQVDHHRRQSAAARWFR